MPIDRISDSLSKTTLTVNDLEALNHGGLQVLFALIDNPTTTEQVSVRTGLGRARVQYFVDKLIERELVVLYKKVQENTKIEKYYKAVSDNFALELSGNESNEENILAAQTIISSLRTSLLARLSNVETAIGKPSTPVLLTQFQCHMSSNNAKIFMDRFNELTRQFADEEDISSKNIFELTVAFYEVTSSVAESDVSLLDDLSK